MNAQFSQLSLLAGPLPLAIYGLSLAALIGVLSRRPFSRWIPRFAVVADVGFALGFLLAWLLGDVLNLFGIDLTLATRLWFSAGIAAVLMALVSLWRPIKTDPVGRHRLTRTMKNSFTLSRLKEARFILPVVAIPLFAFAAGLGINADIGEFPTVGAMLGVDQVSTLAIAPPAIDPSPSPSPMSSLPAAPLWSTWIAPAGMPTSGRYGSVSIPATTSHFRARPAIVYLPPAALVHDAPRLPVLIMLSGQPGRPQDIISSGQFPRIFDAFAKAHHGLAPIVVIPDQLGAAADNPMCLNSKLGNAATYISRDVPAWIGAHFKVIDGPRYWAIGGFSEGGTCSIQLGTAYRSVFGNILDIAGELAPVNGSVAHTIEVAFHGSRSAYQAASPLSLLAKDGPFANSLGIFGVGQNDSRFGPGAATIFHAAQSAGMNAHLVKSRGTAHDWYTVQYVMKIALPILSQRWGLAP